ncbi:MAG: ATP-binding protein [Eubacteriales bacterium]|nr:ATP-binding protein [Eubacteriales bacterium]
MDENKTGGQKKSSAKHIQKKIFATQLILIISLALFLGISGTMINIHFEMQKRDQNLQNVAEAIAHSPILNMEKVSGEEEAHKDILMGYLDSLKDTLDDIDVISVVSCDNIRLYHSTHELIGTIYDGTIPEFKENNREFYTAYDSGPSGTQRRAYSAIYDSEGNYIGFVMAIMLMENIKAETFQTLTFYALITLSAVLIELILSAELSNSIKRSLHGYEPDVFSAMYQVRDNILESLDEGIIAIDKTGSVQFVNNAAVSMLGGGQNTGVKNIVGAPLGNICDGTLFDHTLKSGEKEFNIREPRLRRSDILIDRIPIKDDNGTVGAVGILHDRAEYTKLMEDLTGTRYLVDAMRANNHDFTNKLHVILGLIQMGMYDKATSYIENITIVQRTTISKIMSAVSEPAVAALLIGKAARASELNIKFVLREGCNYSKSDYPLPDSMLVTVIGNLIDNAFEAMNDNEAVYDKPKELMFGIYSKPGALLITTDDTGVGIDPADINRIFENGFSTKGTGRGTGLYQVKTMVDELGGTITAESQKGVGTSFTVSFSKSQ